MTQYQLDLQRPLSINGAQSSRAFYNLVVSIRDVSLFSKGIKPHRGWRITDVKNYFGVKGNPTKVLVQLQELRENLIVS
tara:strand:+ start:192 stop:428 length:237 start_codon:yes stop_codon:yes gene_type:complete